MATKRFLKDPAAQLDYEFDWSTWLASGETISSATVTVPSGMTLDSQVDAADSVTAWLTGGTAGNTYIVTCQITTSQLRTDERSITIEVVNR